MTTTPSLPDLYARVVKVCQGIRILNLYPPTWEGGLWSIDSAGGTSPSISTSMAESLILAACVRWLADNASIAEITKVRDGDDGHSFYQITLGGPYPHFVDTNSLTIAALLAVEAVCKERHNA